MARIAKSLSHCSAHLENTTEQSDDFELHIVLQVGMPCMTARRLGSHLQDYTSLPVIAEALSALLMIDAQIITSVTCISPQTFH
jgi:hypothetical protein